MSERASQAKMLYTCPTLLFVSISLNFMPSFGLVNMWNPISNWAQVNLCSSPQWSIKPKSYIRREGELRIDEMKISSPPDLPILLNGWGRIGNCTQAEDKSCWLHNLVSSTIQSTWCSPYNDHITMNGSGEHTGSRTYFTSFCTPTVFFHDFSRSASHN